MGDPKRQRKRYETPMHPWQKDRIESEKGLIREYGLKNHRELWKVKSFVKKAADQAKKLIGERTEKKSVELKKLISKLHKYGLISLDAQITDVLNIQPRDVLERRLQTLVWRKGLARSIKQSRQLIVHGHISVKGRKVTSPSYLVKVSEEQEIDFQKNSPFRDEDHPERIKILQKESSVEVENKNKIKEEEHEKEISERMGNAIPNKEIEKKSDENMQVIANEHS